jgi:hypothetical protein
MLTARGVRILASAYRHLIEELRAERGTAERLRALNAALDQIVAIIARGNQ